MLEIPNKVQYKKWTMPTRATLKSYWITLIMALFTIGTFLYNEFSENHEIKANILVTLKEFKTSLKQIDYIQKEFNPENIYLGSTDGIIDTINKLNKYNKQISDLIDFTKLHNLIKDYNKWKIT